MVFLEEQIARIKAEHEQDFADFLIGFDHFTLHTQKKKKHSPELIYQRLVEKNKIATRSIQQAYDPEKQLFLADRYIKGTCPRCHAEDQYGDNCEVSWGNLQSD